MKFSQKLTWRIAIAAAVSFHFGSASADEMLFGYALSETSVVSTEGLLPWLGAVEQGTGGEIETSFLAGGSVVTFPTALTALSDGLVDATLVYTPVFRKELPANTLVADLGNAVSDRYAAMAALTEITMFHCPECAEELAEFNAVSLTMSASLPYQLMCREPINSPEDARGLRIRAIGLLSRFVEEIGAVPVNVSVSEIFESMQRGVVDCALADMSWLERFSLNEVVSQVTIVDAGVVNGTAWVAVRDDFYRNQSEENRRVMIEAFPGVHAHIGFFEARIAEAAEEQYADKIEFVQAPEWMVEARSRAFLSVRAEAVEVAQSSGVANAPEIEALFFETYDKYAAELADVAIDEAFWEEFLQTEFYSRYNP